ncbi:hypothetical protein [Chelativorans sp. Marseille-P2723]|uniref:hypothetical protein n=1 Tax=Chelativorans sp. Marseille-P2723 TaxID=2709133 RepID=UPI00156E0574|nr:hypothetical protein [Chelativorans sp. Marseille-P2723]
MLPRLVAGVFPLMMSLLFVGISTTGAHAYLDAGTGSMILQVLLGGLAGLAIAGKLYWHKFLTAIGVRRAVAQSEEAEDASARADR